MSQHSKSPKAIRYSAIMVELVVTPVLGTGAVRCVGSSPTNRTKKDTNMLTVDDHEVRFLSDYVMTYKGERYELFELSVKEDLTKYADKYPSRTLVFSWGHVWVKYSVPVVFFTPQEYKDYPNGTSDLKPQFKKRFKF